VTVNCDKHIIRHEISCKTFA